MRVLHTTLLGIAGCAVLPGFTLPTGIPRRSSVAFVAKRGNDSNSNTAIMTTGLALTGLAAVGAGAGLAYIAEAGGPPAADATKPASPPTHRPSKAPGPASHPPLAVEDVASYYAEMSPEAIEDLDPRSPDHRIQAVRKILSPDHDVASHETIRIGDLVDAYKASGFAGEELKDLEVMLTPSSYGRTLDTLIGRDGILKFKGHLKAGRVPQFGPIAP